ncbi:MAG: DNA polymerase III subunit delta [Steroidobacteraceae bacterium]
MKLQPEALARQLGERLLPVYLISGDEPLVAGEAADAIRARARALGFTEREVHVLDRGTDWDAVRASAGSLSLFAQRRIIELKLPSGKAGVAGGRALASLVQSADSDTLLIILTGRLDRDAQGTEWVRAAEARGAWIAVWPVTGERLRRWLAGRSRKLGITLDAAALELLAERTEGNLLAAQQELEKLRLLAGSELVTAEQVLAGTTDSARFSVGDLAAALAAGPLERALHILDGLESEGAELPLVLWAAVKALRESAPNPARPPVDRLVKRALRADAMAKGRMAGNAWDELSLLACELGGRPVLPLTLTERH